VVQPLQTRESTPHGRLQVLEPNLTGAWLLVRKPNSNPLLDPRHHHTRPQRQRQEHNQRCIARFQHRLTSSSVYTTVTRSSLRHDASPKRWCELEGCEVTAAAHEGDMGLPDQDAISSICGIGGHRIVVMARSPIFRWRDAEVSTHRVPLGNPSVRTL